jgi:hypothetical protein
MYRVQENEALVKHVIRFYAGDIEKLKAYYPVTGANIIVRRLIRIHIEQLEEGLVKPDGNILEGFGRNH